MRSRLSAVSAPKGALECLFGLAILLCFVCLALSADLWTHYDRNEIGFESMLTAPSATHWFGTDHLGRDVFTRTVYAARIDLWMGVAGVFSPLVIGVLAGLVSGFYGGRIDAVLMRLIDITVAFPFLIMVLAIVGIMGPGLSNYFIALALVGWVSYARLVRAEVNVIRGKDYILAAKALGYSPLVIIFKHIFPNTLPTIIVYGTTDIVMVMLAGASLGFIGVGVQPPTPEWGAMIAEGQTYVVGAWWICLFPGLAAMLVGFGFFITSDGLARMLNR
jgi:peptide/nickel transport system permease protein